MKSKLILILSALVSVLVISCQKVIDLDLNTADPKYVIEGIVTKGETVHRVKITRTLNFDENKPFPTVDNAVVVISDNSGNAETLTLVAPGIYETSALLGVEGRTYTVTVTVDGKVFTAQSTIPLEVVFDSLDVLQLPFGTDTFNMLLPRRLDMAGVENFYQYDIYQNGERLDGVYLQDDQFSDGVENEQPLFAGDYLPGDTALVIMYCIDKPVYKYFYSIDANTGSTASPANPDSNFGNSCLGYFSARTRKEQSIIIP